MSDTVADRRFVGRAGPSVISTCPVWFTVIGGGTASRWGPRCSPPQAPSAVGWSGHT